MPTTELERVDSGEAIGRIGDKFKKIKPKLLILQDYNDVYSDHKRVLHSCYACLKGFWFPSSKQVIAMEIYDTELPVSSFPCSIEGIKVSVMLNGARAAGKCAETFRLIIYIV